MSLVTATWTISLWGDCPACGVFVDFADADYFWDGRTLDFISDAKNVELICPECNREVIVDMEVG